MPLRAGVPRNGEGAGRCRVRFTDRYGLLPRAPGGGCGRSAGPYAAFNLGAHVGDDGAAVQANRALLAGDYPPNGPGPSCRGPVFMEQVHGDQVALVRELPSAPVPGVDALVTAVPGLTLAVLVADCVPLILTHPDGVVAAAVHAGREGVRGGVVAAALRTIAELGVDVSALSAWLGPSIGGCCYEVPAAVQEAVAAVVPHARSTTRWGTPSLDLRAAVAAQLRAGGIRSIHHDDTCTYESTSHFSYRRDRVTGRFAGLVAITPAAP